jgi:hypothetical protein
MLPPQAASIKMLAIKSKARNQVRAGTLRGRQSEYKPRPSPHAV